MRWRLLNGGFSDLQWVVRARDRTAGCFYGGIYRISRKSTTLSFDIGSKAPGQGKSLRSMQARGGIHVNHLCYYCITIITRAHYTALEKGCNTLVGMCQKKFAAACTCLDDTIQGQARVVARGAPLSDRTVDARRLAGLVTQRFKGVSYGFGTAGDIPCGCA